MRDLYKDTYNPYQEMKDFYRLDDPTEEEQFRFVEAMEFLIRKTYNPVDRKAFSYNLAMYYRDIKEFHLEKKYLEIGENLGDALCKEQLGFLWYYGLCGEQDFEKAFHYFSECVIQHSMRRSTYMLADMYHYGQYVRKDDTKCRGIIENLYVKIESERNDSRLIISTVFPEVALRLVQMDYEEEQDSMYDLDCLMDARDILARRQQSRPFWGNIKTMRSILETTKMMVGNDYDFIDLYDLMTLDRTNAVVTFDYEGFRHRIDVFSRNDEIIYQYGDKWYHGADDYLEKARIDGKRITTVFDLILDIRIE